METAAKYVGAVVMAYLLGAIPVGLVVGKLALGVDIRNHGSGRTGTTNVLRILGWWAAALVLVADVAKGVGAVLIAGALAHNQMVQAGAGIATVVGHNWPVYAGFRGGRGVCTSLGGLLPLSPWVGLVAFSGWLIVVALTRYVSLGSILSPVAAMAIAGPLVALGREPVALVVYVSVAGILILVQHRDNMVRLARGTERKLGQKASHVPSASARKADDA